jgi:AraC-like DNA-binding protein
MPRNVPARYARSALRLLARPRSDMQQLLRELALPEALLDEACPEITLEPEQFGRLFIALVRLSQNELLADGDSAAQVLSLSTYRLMFSYMLQAPDLRDAIQRGALFFLRFNDQRQSFSLAVAETAEWRFALPAAGETRIGLEHFGMGSLNWLPGLHGRLAALYTWHRLASWLIGSFIELGAVRIDLPREKGQDDAGEPFHAPVYFGQSRCSLEFHPRYLDFPVIRNETDMQRMLETFPAELMRMDEQLHSVAARVRALLGNDFSRALPGLDEIAQRLHMTPATLHRRLGAEGTTFQRLKDECRRDVALALLRQQDLSGARIAERLGFSDASAFLRAFRKWTGLTPGEYRQRELRED